MKKKKLAFVLGIRPDVIRAAFILKHLRQYSEFETVFIWSGQHYSDNLKGVFFRELGVEPAQIELGATGQTDAEISSSVIAKLYSALSEIQPEATVFLGDTNTVTGCLAAAQLNIPIVHIEGCMRSYDWRMPEEKYRSMIDHLSDVIYCYYPEYKEQGVREGLNPNNIVVVGNPIVDVLKLFYFDRKAHFDSLASPMFFESRGLSKGQYFVMTCHRRENVSDANILSAVLNLAGASGQPVFFPASYRTQSQIKSFGLRLAPNIRLVDPVGYEELIALMIHSKGVLTDSGTVVEETAVLGVPVVQMRHSTERPQVYDSGSAVKFDPTDPAAYPAETVFRKLEGLKNKKWEHGLGDGKTSERIATDLAQRMRNNDFRRHARHLYHIPTERSYREDGLA
jgi:UDP-N-acetylglucosamine 2-epimerase (non-hydrolysing)